MSVHDCMCFCGFVLLVFGGIAGIIYVIKKEGERMTDIELKSCIGTIEMLRRLHGVMNVIDAGNCEKIIKVLSDIPKYKDAYNRGWDDGAKATNVDCGVVWEERIDAIKKDIEEHTGYIPILDSYGNGLGYKEIKLSADEIISIIDKHCGGDADE